VRLVTGDLLHLAIQRAVLAEIDMLRLERARTAKEAATTSSVGLGLTPYSGSSW
jgi:hypothetical protein